DPLASRRREPQQRAARLHHRPVLRAVVPPAGELQPGDLASAGEGMQRARPAAARLQHLSTADGLRERNAPQARARLAMNGLSGPEPSTARARCGPESAPARLDRGLAAAGGTVPAGGARRPEA